MTLTSTRNQFREDGVFGATTDDSGKELFKSLEHAYQQPDGTYTPKLQPGTYTCRRGQHQLAHMKVPFETFEVLDVPGHTNILFPHVGNYNDDSEGCTLSGTTITTKSATSKELMLGGSILAFNHFMTLMTGIDEFS
jgi:hypothetical protein